MPDETLTEIRNAFDSVEERFRNKDGKQRLSWCKRSLRARAESVGMESLYRTFYPFASGIHHADIGGLQAQAAKDRFAVNIAPSSAGLTDPLIMSHSALLTVLASLNQVSGAGQDQAIQTTKARFQRVWAEQMRDFETPESDLQEPG